jgi:hypothetical protein
MTATNTAAATTPRQLVRFSQWPDMRPNRTEVYSARQWDNGDLELDVVDHTSGERQFYNDEFWVDAILAVLDIEDAKAKTA